MSDYTAYPTTADVNIAIAAAGSSYDNDPFTADKLASVISMVEKETGRAFPTSASAARYFHGNGYGEMVIDEFIAISEITLIGYYGNASGIALANAQGIERQGGPNNRIIVRKGSYPSFGLGFVNTFPKGRDNIKVTATWGYSLDWTDLWDAIRDEAAAQCLRFSEYNPGGKMTGWKEADVTENYTGDYADVILNSSKRLQTAIERHKRKGQVIRSRNSRSMI